MPLDLNALKQEYVQNVKERNAILETASTRENKVLTDEERTSFDSLSQKGKNMYADIQRIESMREEETKNLQGDQRGSNEKKEFGDFLMTVRFNPNDSTLEVRDSAGHSMGSGAEGGYVVPQQYLPGIRQLSIDDAIFRPRATVIPAGTPPDAKISFPALDQSTEEGMYSGVSVEWIGEGKEKPETKASFREVELTPQEVAATIYITDKLLRNAPAVGPVVQKLMRAAIIGAEEDTFFQGNGVAKPLGIKNSAATLAVDRVAANTVGYTDLVNMVAKFKAGNNNSPDGGSAVWVIHRTVLPQLLNMVDAAGQLIWQPNARAGYRHPLLGYPVIYNDQAPTLGTHGDVSLVDMSYYLIKDGSGPAISMSEHVRFTKNQTCIKIFWNVDGKSWLNTPIRQRDSVTDISPFILLK